MLDLCVSKLRKDNFCLELVQSRTQKPASYGIWDIALIYFEFSHPATRILYSYMWNAGCGKILIDMLWSTHSPHLA